jgi:5-phospho-D-xylono-1,4-lactonase
LSFVRTVLGDILPAELGACDSHEHLIIDGGFPCVADPDFRLADVELCVREVKEAADAGLGAIVDTMPCDAGRNVLKLAEVSRRTGVHVLCPTGLHHERYYDDLHWSHRAGEDRIAELFIADVEEGVDRHDYGAPFIERTPHRAGLVKVAGSLGGLTERDRRIFRAAARAHADTGCPVLTHTEQGTAGEEQIELLLAHGVPPESIVLSHTDLVADIGYHQGLLQAGVFLEFDRHFRWDVVVDENPTLALIERLVADGFGSQLLLGMDAARRGYWTAYGGEPGLSFLVDELPRWLALRGVNGDLCREMLVANPARAFSFVT